ncbi:hypothetical protein CM240_0851 [Clostridium bornimense]|uniref:Nucleotidyltransferase n=1 Tax=Clostridium bornimense TaxID=1216932 RepID=W6SEE1_9CLOT|nr:nucleotidyltransferase domain-containing protein [Clostridium bornimense]CDM68015.1 hypothetical protein CM240_0851 [Clostridium bornimense]
MDFNKLLNSAEYAFLRTNEHLGNNIIMLGLAGSYSYGTNNENSDIDIRGITLNRKSDLIGMTYFEQYVDDNTDTCIYSFNKIINLLLNCNPNTIELLGLKQEHYLYLNDIGKELINNKKLFLSKRAIQSFGGYASAQLRRLQNALARDSYPQEEKEKHIYNSVKNAMNTFNDRYQEFQEGSLKIYIDESNKTDMKKEIFVDANLKHYPLRDYKNIWAEMNNIVKDYDRAGKRNNKKDDNHLNKHAMHLIRLFMMAIDILEKEEINTYRENEQKLLLSIRNGKYQNSDGSFKEEFYEMIDDYEKRLDYASQNTSLPNEPNIKEIEEFMINVNEKVVSNKI